MPPITQSKALPRSARFLFDPANTPVLIPRH
jgi:hypothetical protein